MLSNLTCCFLLRRTDPKGKSSDSIMLILRVSEFFSWGRPRVDCCLSYSNETPEVKQEAGRSSVERLSEVHSRELQDYGQLEQGFLGISVEQCNNLTMFGCSCAVSICRLPAIFLLPLLATCLLNLLIWNPSTALLASSMFHGVAQFPFGLPFPIPSPC